MGWGFAACVMAGFVFSVEAALFAPQQYFTWTNVFIPLQVAVAAWTGLSGLLVVESLAKKPIQLHELLVRAASLVVSLPSAYTLLFQDLGGGIYWTLTDRIDVWHRGLIGLVIAIGWLYVVASLWIDRDKWTKVGEVGVDTGSLLLTDPGRLLGELPPFEELAGLKESNRLVSSLRIEGFKKPKGWTDEMASYACQVLFKEGHEGAGVTVKTGVGDGQYLVFAKFGKVKGLPNNYGFLAKAERVTGVKVEFTPWRPNKEPIESEED
jgi:hypothetical protein